MPITVFPTPPETTMPRLSPMTSEQLGRAAELLRQIAELPYCGDHFRNTQYAIAAALEELADLRRDTRHLHDFPTLEAGYGAEGEPRTGRSSRHETPASNSLHQEVAR